MIKKALNHHASLISINEDERMCRGSHVFHLEQMVVKIDSDQ